MTDSRIQPADSHREPEPSRGAFVRFCLRRNSNAPATSWRTRPRPTKKPTRQNPEDPGFYRVGLLDNGSPGRWPDYPLVSRPRTLVINQEAYLFRLRASHILGAPTPAP